MTISRWTITGTRSKTSGHGMNDEEIIISNPDVPCAIYVEQPWNNNARAIQKKVANYICTSLNHLAIEDYKNDSVE